MIPIESQQVPYPAETSDDLVVLVQLTSQLCPPSLCSGPLLLVFKTRPGWPVAAAVHGCLLCVPEYSASAPYPPPSQSKTLTPLRFGSSLVHERLPLPGCGCSLLGRRLGTLLPCPSPSTLSHTYARLASLLLCFLSHLQPGPCHLFGFCSSPMCFFHLPYSLHHPHAFACPHGRTCHSFLENVQGRGAEWHGAPLPRGRTG